MQLNKINNNFGLTRCACIFLLVYFSVHPLKLADGSLVGDLEVELRRSIISVARDSSIEALVRFLYVLITKITAILTHPPIINGQAGQFLTYFLIHSVL